MPHSGGGGSHSGGSHGGHGSSYHRRSSGRNTRRYSNTYFRGAKKYAYYYKGQLYYYYGTNKYTNDNKQSGIFMIFFGLFFVLFATIFLLSSIKLISGPLDTNYDTSIIIEDNMGIINDKNKLENYFKTFQKNTGITPAVVTYSTDDANMNYSTYVQAYDEYVNKWDDESHWLIYYIGKDLNRGDDWQWELMCGDDCISVLSAQEEDNFTENFHKYLSTNEKYTFEDAIINALNKVNPQTGTRFVYRAGVTINGEYMEPGSPAGFTIFIILGIFAGMGLIVIISGISMCFKSLSEKEKAKLNSFEINQNKEIPECTCYYCGNNYIKGTVGTCPFCGTKIED